MTIIFLLYQMPYHFLGKMSLPQTVYFSISNFWYKLTQPTVQYISKFELHKDDGSEKYNFKEVCLVECVFTDLFGCGLVVIYGDYGHLL